jgi:putative flippase GtrA
MLRKIIIYAIAAVVAIFVNIGSQWLIVQWFGETSLIVYLSILIGTGAGLVSKYVMDKFFVFEEKFSHKQVLSQFILYTLTGVLTTAVFWGVEIAFYYAFQTNEMRYVGGIVGLLIGYVLKFIMDSAFVFKTSK